MIRMTTAFLALGLAALPALAQTTSADGPAADSAAGLGVTDAATFLQVATSANILEIRSSELALERAQQDGVKAFAQKMIADHTAATQKLAETVGQPAPDLSADLSAAMHPDHAKMLGDLEQVQGAGFDQAYVQMQTTAHEQTVAMFQAYATNGEEGPLKGFAEGTVPALQEHFNMAKALLPEQ